VNLKPGDFVSGQDGQHAIVCVGTCIHICMG
jgi:hypothetical protein